MHLVPLAYLSSYLLSAMGNAIAAVALPLIVLQTTGSALGAGTVAAATAVPAVLAGLLMGVVIDRVNRRTCSVVTDLISAAAIAALPLVDLVLGLSLGWFILFGVLGSLGDVPGLTARDALLPAIIRHGAIPAEWLLGVREAVGAVGVLLGPAAAGVLVVLLDGSAVLWITAATSLSAALITLLIPRHVGAVARGEAAARGVIRGGWAQLRAGWSTLRRSDFLLATTLLSLASVLVLGALQGLILPVYFTQAEQQQMLGFALAALAAGTLLGGTVYAVAGHRGRRRAWWLVGLVGSALGYGLIAPLPSVWVVLTGGFIVGLSSGVFGSIVGVLMIERIPEEMRGRIMGTQNALMTAAAPAGIMLAAVLAEYAGVVAAAMAVVVVWALALVLGALGRSLRNLDSEPASLRRPIDPSAVKSDA